MLPSMGLNCCSYDKNNYNHHLLTHTSEALSSMGNMHKRPKFPLDTLTVRSSCPVHASSLKQTNKQTTKKKKQDFSRNSNNRQRYLNKFRTVHSQHTRIIVNNERVQRTKTKMEEIVGITFRQALGHSDIQCHIPHTQPSNNNSETNVKCFKTF